MPTKVASGSTEVLMREFVSFSADIGNQQAYMLMHPLRMYVIAAGLGSMYTETDVKY